MAGPLNVDWSKEANLSTIFSVGGAPVIGLEKEIASVEEALKSGRIGASETKGAAEYLNWLRNQSGKKDDSAPGGNSTASTGGATSWWDKLFPSYDKPVDNSGMTEEAQKAHEGSTSLLTDPAGYFKNMGGNIALTVLGVIIVGGAVLLIAKDTAIKGTLKKAIQ